MLDMLLKLLGEKTNSYESVSDKWISISVIVFNNIENILPYLLFLIAWAWFFFGRNHKKSKKNVIKTIIASVVLFFIGWYLPEVVRRIIIGIAIRNFYE